MSGTHTRLDNPSGWGTPFSIVLSLASAGVCAVVVILFGIGWFLFVRGNFFGAERNSMHFGLIFLFLVPIVLQIAGLIAMFIRLHRDKSLTAHYGFCLLIMCSCPLSYCGLWICYMNGWHGWEVLSYCALGAICFSLLPVVIMTYAIMWTRRAPTLKDGLTENEITDWAKFCAQLKTDGAALGGYRRRILERLDNDLRQKLMHANSDADYHSISKTDLVGDLNRILIQRDLHLAINFNADRIGEEARGLLIQGQRKLTNADAQRLHRLLVEASFAGSVSPSQAVDGHGFKEKLRKAVVRWDDTISNIKEGITKAHFWVLVNFFAVFLGVTYLLSFAFAFHDQRAIADEKGPDLYMPRTSSLLNGAKQMPTPSPAKDAPPTMTAADVKYTFYFDSISAHPNISEHSDFNEKAFVPNANSVDKVRDWKQSINYSQLKRATDEIRKLTEKGEKLRVELIGSSDFCDLQASPYSSNYELSEARAQNVRYLLMKKLTEQDTRERQIEWVSLPVSSESSPLVPSSADYSSQVNCEEQRRSTKLMKRKIDSVAEERLIASLRNEKDTVNMDLKHLDADDVNLLRSKIDDLVQTVREVHLTQYEEIREPLGRIKVLASAINDSKSSQLTDEQKADRKRVVQRKEVELQESFDAFQYVDESGGKRVVIVSLNPVRDSNWFIPLALMDYVNFTITSTTTGSGEIVSTTNFAKFLCSAAHILDVFFLVVFFNVLLSVRGENRLARSTDRR